VNQDVIEIFLVQYKDLGGSEQGYSFVYVTVCVCVCCVSE